MTDKGKDNIEPGGAPPLKDCIRCGKSLNKGETSREVLAQFVIGYHIQCFKDYRKEYIALDLPDGYREDKKTGEYKMYREEKY